MGARKTLPGLFSATGLPHSNLCNDAPLAKRVGLLISRRSQEREFSVSVLPALKRSAVSHYGVFAERSFHGSVSYFILLGSMTR